MDNAIKEIAFIPSLQNVNYKMLASDAFMDRLGISEAISAESLVNHINRTYSFSFDIKNQISNIWKGSKILNSYGVFIFDKQKLKSLFDDKNAFEKISIELNIKLINFLYEYYLQYKTEQEDFVSILQSTRFLLDESNALCLPEELFFPSSYKEQNTLAENTRILHSEINTAIVSNQNIVNWLSLLGVGQLSDLTFIENELCKIGYVTTENALEVGKFIFKVSQREDIFGKISQYRLSNVVFLTTKGVLKSAKELFLSAKYKPEVNIEALLEEDIFISEKYCEDASIVEWKTFLLKMGVSEDVSNKTFEAVVYDENYKNRYDKRFFDTIKEYSERYKWIAYEGWDLHRGFGCRTLEIFYDSFSFLTHCNKYNFSKLVFSRIISQYNPEEIDTNVRYVKVSTGYERNIGQSMLTDLGANINHFKWVIENCAILPTVKHDCRKAIDTFSNSIPQIKEIAGNYLPVIDVEEEITESWQTYLHLKNHLTLEDYLFLLTEISNDIENIENNKTRISCIYQKLIEFGCLESDKFRNKIQEWSSSNLILSKDNKFVSPSELSYITLDGFDSKKHVYIGSPSNRDKVIELLALMGVKIITSESINTEFESKTVSLELKNILKGKVSALALLASGENTDESLYNHNKSKLIDLIDNTNFYHCKSIKLTYGDSNDVIEKHTFGNKNEFYYIGNLRPANIEPLLTPLCKYLNIRGKERELFILFIENFEGIRQNLKDKGYKTDLLEEGIIADSGTIQTSYNRTRTESQYERDVVTGFKGEIIVYEKLKSMGYDPICLSISTKEDYTHLIEMNGVVYYCKPNYEKYDISFITNNGVQMYVEVKSTTRNKYCQENIPISYRELTMIEECNESDEKSYVIVRVFGVDAPTQDIYVFKSHLL